MAEVQNSVEQILITDGPSGQQIAASLLGGPGNYVLFVVNGHNILVRITTMRVASVEEESEANTSCCKLIVEGYRLDGLPNFRWLYNTQTRQGKNAPA